MDLPIDTLDFAMLKRLNRFNHQILLAHLKILCYITNAMLALDSGEC